MYEEHVTLNFLESNMMNCHTIKMPENAFCTFPMLRSTSMWNSEIYAKLTTRKTQVLFIVKLHLTAFNFLYFLTF